MNCEICKKSFTGIESFQQHQASAKHKKKVLQIHNGSTSSEVSKHLSNIQDSNPARIPCTTCAMTFQTLSEFAKHSESEEHALMILLRKKNNETKSSLVDENSCDASSTKVDRENCDSTSEMEIGTELVVNNLKAVISWQPRCEKCDKNFSGPEPYQQHIVSLAHKKKCNLSSTCETPKEILLSNSYSCETCSVTFNGPVPYQDHIRSESHKRKIAVSSSAGDNSKENTAVSKLMGILKCEICDKTFSGPFPYEQHMASPAHKKVVERRSYFEKFLDNSASVSCGSGVELSKKTNSQATSLPWYCEVCKIQCSGIDPYQQHMAGKAHIKKSIMVGADSKRTELQSLLSGQSSSIECSSVAPKQVVSHSEIDGGNTATGGVGQNVKSPFLCNDLDIKVFTPSDLEITFFAVGEEIDFDKDTKTKFSVNDLDMVDIDDNDENEEMDE